jgi:hypothetical protein
MSDKFRATYGQPGTSTQPLVINAMGVSVTTNASGDGTYTFTTPFPNGLYGFQVTYASNTAPPTVGGVIVQGYGAGSGASDRTKVSLRAYQTSGAVLPSFTIVVNITAFGW